MQRKYNMTTEENISLAKRNLVDYIWKSANLEGIGVTYPDTQAICNGMSVSGYSIDEINSVNDLKHAWQFLLENIREPLNLQYIQKTHMLLGKFTVINAGTLRRFDVNIGGTEWKPEIPDEQRICGDIQMIIDADADRQDTALDMMLYLMRSQIFYDGNKRLAMLIGNKIMIENGMGIISVKQKYIQDFYKLLIDFYETNDPAYIKRFVYDNCIDGLNFA
ncbi:MAG: cell filamentation protein Fic [Oscillospiraceae bacterium]|nr:cell filamentation protein Fic [Oscillospiraceae bacterium]